MKKIKLFTLSFLFVSLLQSCVKDDNVDVANQVRDYQTQYNADISQIENFLKTHSITVVNHPGFPDDQNISFSIVPSLDPTSIWGTDAVTPNSNLLTKNVTKEGVVHKIYYLKHRDGVGTSPTLSNQIKIYYKCFLVDNQSSVMSTSSENGADVAMNQLILGWQNILPEFKMGTITGGSQYNDYGAGVMFLPSAMAYYEIQVNQIPAYSPLIYNFKLFNVF